MMAAQPATQHFPIPRATTAACEVIPPREVRMPCAAFMPLISSGEVSARTRITLWPEALRVSASSALKTISPQAAPGEAGRPLAITVFAACGSSVGCSRLSSFSASTLKTASRLSISPSATMSRAILIAALTVRLPFRVCRSQSL